MGAFGASVNWNREGLSFANSRIKVKATHRIEKSTHPTSLAQCSVVVVMENNVESVPIYLTKKCCRPPQHEMAVHVETSNAPAETIAALIKPRMVTAEDVHSSGLPKAFHR